MAKLRQHASARAADSLAWRGLEGCVGRATDEDVKEKVEAGRQDGGLTK